MSLLRNILVLFTQPRPIFFLTFANLIRDKTQFLLRFQMNAKTTVARSKTFTSDQIWLNGKKENVSNPRLLNCLREIRIRGNLDPDEHIHICSENNFPTAAGLASSAAGYACLGTKFVLRF